MQRESDPRDDSLQQDFAVQSISMIATENTAFTDQIANAETTIFCRTKKPEKTAVKTTNMYANINCTFQKHLYKFSKQQSAIHYNT